VTDSPGPKRGQNPCNVHDGLNHATRRVIREPVDQRKKPTPTLSARKPDGVRRDHAAQWHTPASETERDVALLRDILEMTGEVAYRYRLWPDPGYEFVSDSVFGLMGYSAEEFYADPMLPGKLVYPPDADLMRSVLQAPSGVEVELQVRWVRRNGSLVDVELRCVVTHDATGRAVRVDGVARDVACREAVRGRLQLVQWRGRLRERTEGSADARVVIADDHELTRAGLRAVLASDSGLNLVGEATDGQEAVALVEALQPDLVLMDVRMPGLDGLEATRAIKRVSPMTSVLVLSMFEDADLLLAAVKAGAAGYVLKGATEVAIRSAIWEVLAGDLSVDQHLARKILRQMAVEQPAAQVAPPGDRLSAREHEVLGLVARGHTNREIADALIISSNTVKIHVEHILAKLEVSDRTQAAVRSIELGYISPDHAR
jgi:two-component system, NarL family, response regulator LiaR